MSHARFKAMRVSVLAWLATGVYGLVKSTIRPVIGPDAAEILDAFAENERIIVAFWHGQLAMMQAPYRGKGAGICIQVSRHTDGEIITRAVRPFGVRTARGSATRGGVASVRDMLGAFADGYDLAMAIDGPRGPYQRAKPGATRLAQATGARLFPVAAAPRRGWRARSWDRFVVPLPFTRVYYTAGRAMRLARDAGDDAIETARRALEDELNRLTAEAERRAREG
jgi:lysophospholipid acyltransferase (LPLAT)-like uncharacterized protein